MTRLRFLFDEEEEKEEEKFGWKERTRGIGELPEYKPISTKLKFTADVGIGASAVGSATEDTSLHLGRNPYLVEINGLKSELERSGTILDNYDNSLTKLDEQFKTNPTQELADQYNSILSKRKSLFNEYQTKGNTLDNLIDEYNKTVKIKNEQIDVKYKHAFKRYKQETGLPSAQLSYYTPLSEPKSFWDIGKDKKLMKLHKINFESYKLWFKELKESKDKVAFLKGEGQSPELKELRKEYSELAPHMYRKSEQWISNVSMIAVGVGMVHQLANTLVTSGFRVKDKVFSAKEIKEVLGRARAAYNFETGKFRATLSDNDFTVIKQINNFLKTTGKSPAARKMLEKVVEKTGGLSFPQQVNIFGTKLYAGLPADEIVKSIVEVGKVTTEMVRGLDPGKVTQITQQLLNIEPALASEFSKVIAKAEVEEAEAPKVEVNLADLKKELAGRMTKERIFLEEIEEAVGQKIDVKKPEDIQIALDYVKKVKEKVKEEAPKVEGKEPVVPEVKVKEERKSITKAEAEEVLKVEPKKPSKAKIELAKEMVKKDITLEKIEDIVGKKIDVKKPKDIVIALNKIKAVKVEVKAKEELKVKPKITEEKFKEAMEEKIYGKVEIPEAEEVEPTPEEIKETFKVEPEPPIELPIKPLKEKIAEKGRIIPEKPKTEIKALTELEIPIPKDVPKALEPAGKGEVLYHVTTGVKGIGLGTLDPKGETKSISFTTDKGIAENIKDILILKTEIAKGDLGYTELRNIIEDKYPDGTNLFDEAFKQLETYYKNDVYNNPKYILEGLQRFEDFYERKNPNFKKIWVISPDKLKTVDINNIKIKEATSKEGAMPWGEGKRVKGYEKEASGEPRLKEKRYLPEDIKWKLTPAPKREVKVEPTKVEPKVELATPTQIKQAHAIADSKALISEKGKMKPQYREIAKVFTGQKSVKDMTPEEAETFIDMLSRLPEPTYKKGKLVPPSIPRTMKLTTQDFFRKKYGEPTPIWLLTDQTYYATQLGIKPLVEPFEKGKQEFDLEYRQSSNLVDRMVNKLNKIEKTPMGERIKSKIKNVPTKAESKMAELINKHETTPSGLSEKEEDVFKYFRNLSKDIWRRENEVRGKVDLPPIKYKKAYFRHTADAMAKEMLEGKYPFPQGIKYWSEKMVGKKIFNPMEFHRKLSDELIDIWSKDIRAVTKSMLWNGLKEIYLAQPAKFLNEQLNAISKDLPEYKNLTPKEKAAYDQTRVMPASTKKWLINYVNQVLKGQETETDASLNRIVTKSGLKGIFDKVLSPFGRSIGRKPITNMFMLSGRMVISGVMGWVPRQIIRNTFQQVQNLALYGVKATIKAFLPASIDKNLKGMLNESLFLKSYTGFEELPTNLMGKIEKIWLGPYGIVAVNNAKQGMKASYWNILELIKNPKFKKHGWADPQRTKDTPKGFLYPSEEEKLSKEMEFGSSATQYQYIPMGMPGVFRYKALVPLTRLQSWWMNYFTKFLREAIHRGLKGKPSWAGEEGPTFPWSRRVNFLKYLIIGGAILTFLGYRKSFLLGVLPVYLSPAMQLSLGLYNYATATEDWQKERALRQIYYSWKAFIPGSLAWRDFLSVWNGEKNLEEILFYGKKKKEIIKEPLKITIPEKGKLKFTEPKIKSTKLKFNF